MSTGIAPSIGGRGGIVTLFDQFVAADGNQGPDTGAGFIPPGFVAIEVFISGRSVVAAAVTTSAVGLQLNGDAGTNYYYDDSTGVNATATAGNNQASPDHVLRVNMPGTTAGAGSVSYARYVFPNYDTTDWNKAAVLSTGMFDPTAAANGRGRVAVAYWNNAQAINRIALVDNSGAGFKARTRMTIIGIR